MMLVRSLQKQSVLLQGRTTLAMNSHAPSIAHFSKHIPTDNTPLIPPEMMELEKKEFQERVSQKKRDLLAAERLASLKLQQDWIDDKDKWWNKIMVMTDAEIKLMPLGFIRKYGSYISNLKRYNDEFHLQENKNIADYYQQIKRLKKL